MKYGVREASVRDQVIEDLRSEGAWARKIHGNEYVAGLPDICAVHNKRTCWIETKKPPTREGRRDGGDLSALQRVEFAKMVQRGAVIFVSDDAGVLVNWALAYFEDGFDDMKWRPAS